MFNLSSVETEEQPTVVPKRPRPSEPTKDPFHPPKPAVEPRPKAFV